MAGVVDNRLKELGIELPPPARAVGKYVGFVHTGKPGVERARSIGG